MYRPLLVLLATVAVTVAVVGCGEDLTFPDRGVDEDGGEVVYVQALDNTFRPGTVRVEAGTTLLFMNRGRNDHDVLPSDGSTGWGITRDDFTPGDEYRVALAEPGVYPYYCSLHGTTTAGMIGTVEVVDSLEES